MSRVITAERLAKDLDWLLDRKEFTTHMGTYNPYYKNIKNYIKLIQAKPNELRPQLIYSYKGYSVSLQRTGENDYTALLTFVDYETGDRFKLEQLSI